ncbi:hypothetical protein ACTOB_006685 [Actinoplanes oblitus]|uniref:Uncharacterized protein n=1 Tax=Actinoplanes oblitus TaxID=3040509 RepID=A0ABY8W9U3_9ACTN|nr:hypothetical protein [Actinoplanes oblitus]WIM94644.1 hypothetical protein ACTOB_006685 [Actinoplanes oblitus]
MVTAMAGCGADGDTKAACDAIKAELTGVTSKGMQQIDDPRGLAKTYSDSAAKVREEAKKADGDVRSTAESVATLMDGFATTISAGSTQMPDVTAFTNATVKLTEACK